MPLPYPGRQRSEGCSRDEAALRAAVNLQVCRLNHLKLGEPEIAPLRVRGEQPLTASSLEIHWPN